MYMVNVLKGQQYIRVHLQWLQVPFVGRLLLISEVQAHACIIPLEYTITAVSRENLYYS